jgi:RimJ/RimL family protein N-acetyltransferase
MKLTQRSATLGDAAILLSWRNDPTTRMFSLHSEKISSNEHLGWLRARLERVESEPFFIFSGEFKPVGMSRLDVVSGSFRKFEVSIMVDPTKHGKGIGTKILKMTCETFFGLHPKCIIVARIHQYNYASQKLFASSGFKLLPQAGKFFHYEKKL